MLQRTPSEECQCSNSFCRSLPAYLRARLCEGARRVTYKKRNEQVMFLDFHYLLIVESGHLLISRAHRSDRQQGTDIVTAGNVVGIAQILRPELKSIINLLPITQAQGCLVRLKTVEELLETSPELGKLLVTELAERFGRVAGKLAIHSYGSARERLDYSLERVRELGLSNEVRQEDLASLAGLSRVTVSRLINSGRRHREA